MVLTISGLLGLDEEPRPLVAQHLELFLVCRFSQIITSILFLPRVAARRLLRLL